jgi:hypothetical protein
MTTSRYRRRSRIVSRWKKSMANRPVGLVTQESPWGAAQCDVVQHGGVDDALTPVAEGGSVSAGARSLPADTVR